MHAPGRRLAASRHGSVDRWSDFRGRCGAAGVAGAREDAGGVDRGGRIDRHGVRLGSASLDRAARRRHLLWQRRRRTLLPGAPARRCVQQRRRPGQCRARLSRGAGDPTENPRGERSRPRADHDEARRAARPRAERCGSRRAPDQGGAIDCEPWRGAARRPARFLPGYGLDGLDEGKAKEALDLAQRAEVAAFGRLAPDAVNKAQRGSAGSPGGAGVLRGGGIETLLRDQSPTTTEERAAVTGLAETMRLRASLLQYSGNVARGLRRYGPPHPAGARRRTGCRFLEHRCALAAIACRQRSDRRRVLRSGRNQRRGDPGL